MNVVALSKALLAQGRPADAHAALRAAAEAPDAAADVLQASAAALKALGRLPEAAEHLRRAVAIAPTARVAWHNLAAALGDLGRDGEARDAAQTAIDLGLDAPETRLVLGRAAQGLGRLNEAEASFREALRRRPSYYDAHRDLAQLIWMRTGDLVAALQPVERALAEAPAPDLFLVKALVSDRAGRTRAALEQTATALERWPDHVGLLGAAAAYAGDLGLAEDALRFAQRAWRLAPDQAATAETLGVALLGAGRAQEAFDLAASWRRRTPYHQTAIALEATAARLLGREAYAALYDYGAFVRPARLPTPDGWASLDSFLADLAAALERLHAFKAHPLENSLRGGSQTASDLTLSDEPAVRAFFQAIDGPIRDYMAALGTGDDPLRSRNTGAYAFRGAWSVRLRSGGNHVDHVHPQGWLSSAFYVVTPTAALERPGREGWIRFGKPRHLVRPALEAEHWVRPEPGTLVLFPSYMWHGTEPFTTDELRMTIAFDVVPA